MAPSTKPVITVSILAISVVIAIISRLGDQLESLQGLFYSFYLQPMFVEIKQGQLWRLITPIFIHFGALHLLMNGVMLWLFGRLIEHIHGIRAYIMMILIIAVISNTAQYLVSGPLFGGLSGVLYGLLGLVWAMGKLSPSYPLQLAPKFTYFIMGWFVLCWSGLLSMAGIHIANTAHTAGLISGLILAFILTRMRRSIV